MKRIKISKQTLLLSFGNVINIFPSFVVPLFFGQFHIFSWETQTREGNLIPETLCSVIFQPFII